MPRARGTGSRPRRVLSDSKSSRRSKSINALSLKLPEKHAGRWVAGLTIDTSNNSPERSRSTFQTISDTKPRRGPVRETASFTPRGAG